MSLSPCSTCTSTRVWLSATVVNTRLLRVGMVLLRSMSGVKVPSLVSMPRVWGVTSRRTRSLTSPWMMPVWMAAPMATPSSGLTARLASLPKTLRTSSVTLGARVWPPTSRTSSIWSARMPASARQRRQGSIVRSRRSSVRPSYFCRVSTVLRCLGPEASAEMKGSTISVCCAVRELALGLLRRLLEPLQGHAVLPEVDAGLAQELGDEPVDDPLVEVFAAQEGVAAGGPHLEEAVRHLQDRDVEGAAAQVVDRDVLALGVLQAVGEGGRRRLVEDARDLEAGDEARVLRGLPLGVVEVGGDGDDRLFHRLPEVVLGGRLELGQHEGGDLGRGVDLVLDLDGDVAVAAPPRSGRA